MNRRRFLQTAGAVSAVALTTRRLYACRVPVQVGAISYSFRQIPGSAEQILGYMQELGLHVIELMGQPAEEFAGAPPVPPFRRGDMTTDERAAYIAKRQKAQEEVSRWRLGAPMERFAELGAMFRDGGVEIDILKLGSPSWSDAEIDYAFKAAKAVGARGISFEISDEAAARMGPFAAKHGMVNSMHNHTQVANEGFSFDTPLSHSPANMLNLDIGHYVAGLGTSPVPIIHKYHDRITHLHLKDRRNPENGQDNVVWGEGDTPIGEVLRVLRDKGYPIAAMIELEYPIPEGSSVLAEMARCVAFCHRELES